jgi:hypothetical protein
VVLDPADHAPSQLPETSGVATIARNCRVFRLLDHDQPFEQLANRPVAAEA